MKTRTILAAALASIFLLSACAKKDAGTADHSKAKMTMEEEADAAANAPAAPEPVRTYDHAKMAQGMLSLVADRPECQSYRDQLMEIAKSPDSAVPQGAEPSAIVAKAHEAGCSAAPAQ